MKITTRNICRLAWQNGQDCFWKSTAPLVLALSLIAAPFAAEAVSQGASSIVIHDTTTAANGGESSTSSFRSEFASALAREKPCVETMDDQDIRDTIQDERERELLEGGDSNEALKNLGDRMGASMVMTVGAMSVGGGKVYSASVMDTKTARTVARETGGDGSAKQMAEKLVRSLGPQLADDCKPHWVETVIYSYTFNESKQTTDGGATHATRRNVKRTINQTSMMTTTIKATLQKPPSGGSRSVNSPNARVMHRVQSIFEKRSSSNGEERCRLPGRNPFFKGFSDEYSETVTQLGQGTDVMPVSISIDGDGSYSIKVTAPGGTLYGKIETSRSSSTCTSDAPPPVTDAQGMPEGKLQATSFDAEGISKSAKPDSLSGSQTSADGRTKISWNLRLVKPKGK